MFVRFLGLVSLLGGINLGYVAISEASAEKWLSGIFFALIVYLALQGGFSALTEGDFRKGGRRR